LLFGDHAIRFGSGERARQRLVRTCRDDPARVARKPDKIANAKLFPAEA
jgi:hypothetical protein